MKTLASLALVLSLSLPARGAVCKGEDPCLACKNCSLCWYCNPLNPKSGSCSVVRNETLAAQAKRLEIQRKQRAR